MLSHALKQEFVAASKQLNPEIDVNSEYVVLLVDALVETI